MILSVYSLHDTVARSFNKPFVQVNDAVAVRSLKDAMRNDKTLLDNAGDYVLHLVGQWNDDTGVLSEHAPSIVVVNCGALAQELAEEKSR